MGLLVPRAGSFELLVVCADQAIGFVALCFGATREVIVFVDPGICVGVEASEFLTRSS